MGAIDLDGAGVADELGNLDALRDAETKAELRPPPDDVLKAHGLEVTVVNKVAEGRPHVVDMIKNGDISMIVNTVEDTRTAISDSRSIRTTALAQRVTYFTTIAGARAACTGMKALATLEPYRLQDLHAKLN